MAITQRELVERQKNPTTQAKKQQNLVLKNFVENASEMLTKLSQEFKNIQNTYRWTFEVTKQVICVGQSLNSD